VNPARDNPLNVLYLDNHLIAIAKPPGLPTQSESMDRTSLLELTRQWVKLEFKKPGKAYLGLVHRLDSPVAGAVLFARTTKAASRLSRQFRERSVKKSYRAIVEGRPQSTHGSLTHYLRKEKSLKATVFPRPTPDAKKAELTYAIEESLTNKSILEIGLKTGRFHQIRAQLSFMGHPIVGDLKYGASTALPEKHIALYASRLILHHPISGEEIVIECPPPTHWAMVLKMEG
jgi:23S rRNA pseudouridine1911/1915/1917 synthase